jgi:hypothetical protein
MILADFVAKTGEAAKSGPIGLAVILILIIVCYFLFKSMSKHMRIVREQFPDDEKKDEPVVEQAATPTETGDGPTGQPGPKPPST